ncbi:TetR family transcriptional regulator C-terminal domain-containing protein [Pseudosulfitobacter sp. DSM 107133]|jgi:TetR/AcrR family transcriptional regulator|uniref:TetR family transcriptional regulator C-terminal domain-containing protein n=1 Tax=Pseudosulfitobacter sp. DSM 107133 TaxID=2883100 RepID=UPI0013B3B9E2|nr:TetR family transcriptional regulator C-terminal domain-containing protein [Pseudosulfitobacter sp. DSM 107133]UOA28891.1 HTH-type transcriptional regulator RutR [Pseudosulfitobacter sp. DSM 107133]
MTTAKIRRSAINEAIRDAAIREFARNGLAGTSTQAIARSAGISKAQLHYYITSKEDLYQDVLGYIVSHWRELFSLSSSLENPAEAITNYIRRKIEHALEHPEVSRFFANEMARGGPEMGDHWGPLRTSVQEANDTIQGWIDAGNIAPVDPLLFQINMWAVTQHYAEYEAQARALMGAAEGQPMDAERIIAEASALFLRRCGLDENGARI